MRTAFILFFGLSLLPAFAQVQISQTTGDRWILENQALKVTLDTRAVAFDVLDKRCGRVWSGIARRPAESYGLTIGAASPGLKLDFSGDWHASEISLTAADQTEGSAKPTPADLSATVDASWTPDALHLSVHVRDQAVFFPKPDSAQWWNWDSIEFWVGDQQYAVLPAPPGGVLLAVGKGAVAGSQVVSRLVAGGWEVEFSLPWPGGAAPGDNVIPFALGVNDADDGHRKSQLYFPRSWRHSAPDSFARAKFADVGEAPHLLADAPPIFLTDIAPLPTHDGLRMTGPTCSVTSRHLWQASLTLRLEGSDVVVGIDKDPRDFSTQPFTAFSPLAADKPAELYSALYCDGVAIPDTDTTIDRYWSADGSMDMPWLGYGLPGGPGYALLFEDSDDAGAILEPRGNDSRLVPVAYHWAQKDKFAYARSIRYGFVDKGGFVAMAKWYRKRAIASGAFKTLRQKLATRPQLERIKGAPDFWGSDPSICYDMRRYGIRHAIVNGPFPADAMRKIEGLGYLVSRYDNYEDMLEGPRDHENSGHIPDDVEKLSDGTPVTAWLTWDKKVQYYKQCSMLYEGQARRLIPPDLATHPYNARFIDVTTACGLRECYDKVHPHTRTEDRDARMGLARYVADECKLVLGGEHGKWWGTPYYDYFEGMQSGNRTSWPAGYVGTNIPEKREDLKPQDWMYGVGHERRVPLWRLVYGDCSVSTWYWGDSTGHIYKAAPEYADRQDCFNILSGTVPLFWVSNPYGFRWSDPDLRLRLLQSYYVTCPVTEQTAFAEMTDFKYLSDDRSVQQTGFDSGITVTVNFGDKPYTTTQAKTPYVLPNCGFLATGKDVLAYRATIDGRTITWVRTPTAMYADAGGKMYDFGPIRTDGRCAVEIVEPGNVRVITLSGAPPSVDFSSLGSNWGAKSVHVYAEDQDMTPERDAAVTFVGGQMKLPADAPFARILFGQSFDRPNLAITGTTITPKSPKQGDTVKLTVNLRNDGGKGTGSAFVALYLDARDKAHLLDTRRTDIASAGVATVTFSVPTTKLDGVHKLIAVVDPDDLFHEPNRKRTVAMIDLPVLANPAMWPSHIDFDVAAPAVTHTDYPAEVYLQLSPDQVGDPTSARVVRLENGVPVAQPRAQLESLPSPEYKPNSRWQVVLIDTFPAGKPAHYRLLYGKPAQPLSPPAPIAFDKTALTVTADAYSCRFDNGRLVDLACQLPGAIDKPIAQWIASSDAAFGWSSETADGPVEVVPVVVGPAHTAILVTKKLGGGYEFQKTWHFYPSSIVLTCNFNKAVGVWSRTGIALPATYADNAGHHTDVDGKGQSEGVVGQLKWYAAWTDKWGFTGISISPTEGQSAYWDEGVADQGFGTPQTQNLRAAYVIHPGQTSEDFAAADYAAYTEPLKVTVHPH